MKVRTKAGKKVVQSIKARKLCAKSHKVEGYYIMGSYRAPRYVCPNNTCFVTESF
jgi:hypothetical protein